VGRENPDPILSLIFPLFLSFFPNSFFLSPPQNPDPIFFPNSLTTVKLVLTSFDWNEIERNGLLL
jgi:hypothetical protein